MSAFNSIAGKVPTLAYGLWLGKVPTSSKFGLSKMIAGAFAVFAAELIAVSTPTGWMPLIGRLDGPPYVMARYRFALGFW